MSNQHGTAVPRCSKIDHWTVFSPRGFVLSLLSFFCLIEQRSLWNDGFRVERRAAKRTHVAPPKGTSEHCFGCQRVRQSFSFGEKKPKKPKNKPVLQLLLLIQRGEGRGGGLGGGGVASECQRFSVWSVTNCQQSFLRTFYCCIQMEHRGSPPPLHSQLWVFSSLFVSVSWKGPPPPFPPTSINTTQASCAPSLGACKGARECFSFPLLGCLGSRSH